MSVVGITRFSTIFRSNHPFRDAGAPFEERTARLFDTARLNRRFEIWEALTLPSLAAQTDARFSMVIVTSALLPEWARARLESGLRDQPFDSHIIAPNPTANYSKTVKRGVRIVANDTYGEIGTFRLDDDDGLAADWVTRFRAAAKTGRQLTPRTEIYGFNRGWFVSASDEGVQMAEVTRPLIACGLGRVSLRKPLRTIHDARVAHHKLGAHYPTTEFDDEPAWIVSAHGLNDSDRLQNSKLVNAPLIAPAEAQAALGQRFAGVDVRKVAKALVR